MEIKKLDCSISKELQLYLDKMKWANDNLWRFFIIKKSDYEKLPEILNSETEK